MTLAILEKPVPLTIDPDSVIRLKGSRITLETVVITFNQGATAEEIVQQYPSLKLADIDTIIGYYLSRKKEIDEYIQQQQQKGAEIKKINQIRFNSDGIRERLLLRQSQG